MNPTIAIIGAGLTGLTCASLLARAGHRVVVLDKGRGIGGRLATRHSEKDFQFDHGAQYISANSDEFAAFLEERRKSGALALWDNGLEGEHYVGMPDMRSFAQSLVQGFDVRSAVDVSSIRATSNHVEVTSDGQTTVFDQLVLTIPAPQILHLVGDDHAVVKQIQTVEMTPNLTLMAGFKSSRQTPFLTARDPQSDLAWIARNDTKPGRSNQVCWVAQAGLLWSRAHLELSKQEIAAKMLPLLCARIGMSPEDAAYVRGHRWRYAQASAPLGRPFLTDETGRLRIGGDWCLGSRAEHAWKSGVALAEDLMNVL